MCASPADPIYLPPLSPSTSAQTKHHLLVFLPGNPGYPGYYAPFLSALRTGLPASPSGEDAIHIRCLTLPGFAPPPTDPQPQPNSPPPPKPPSSPSPRPPPPSSPPSSVYASPPVPAPASLTTV
ncbi:hypothetical protein VC83_00585 [Pseudogymnoascus destructans]|uniref:Uncharacterized protein n=1 Tax=Pseudogymnoascus destructans TaxID=655981 RepID=A0A177ANS8_9PEZI|nr:uncharacterized protein VC83_00585 [Pseudogymnoascus destructans]OAF62943.1 hypothetical protein VC83_00585 [Pseudogymnoascus destructans]